MSPLRPYGCARFCARTPAVVSGRRLQLMCAGTVPANCSSSGVMNGLQSKFSTCGPGRITWC